MLNFTYSSKESDGQFNGRFAFRSPISSSAFKAFDLRVIANSTRGVLEDTILRHEYLHWKVFQHSYIGRALVGKRYRVRALFLSGFDKSVRNYYIQRSFYFLSVYKVHEEIVEELNESIGPSMDDLCIATLSSNQLRRIKIADGNAFEKCQMMGVPFSRLELRIDSYLGKIATKEFGVQAYLPVDDRATSTRLCEVALKGENFGVFNACMDLEFSDNPPAFIRIGRQILRLARVEKWFGALDDNKVNKNKLVKWAFLKFSTELLILNSVHNVDFNEPRSYVDTMVRFISRYIGRPCAALEEQISELLGGCLMYPEETVIQRLQLLDYDFLYFFYVHGN